MVDDPIWPRLGWPIGEDIFAQPTAHGHPAPFLGGAARIHRRFGSPEDFDVLLANDDALAFVARRLHVDLRRYPEYLGSVALLVPDPVIEKIDNFMIPASGERGERIFYRFIAKPGQTLEGTTITMFDEQAHLLTSVETRDMPADGILDIDKGSCTGAYGYAVTHPEHGILTHHPSCEFLRQIRFNTHLSDHETIRVSVPTGDSPNSERMEYLAASRSHLATDCLVGEESSSPDANVRVATAVSRRARLASAEQYGQRWFPNGSREQAMRFLQEQIRKARSRIVIADPYLGGLQLGQFLYAANRDQVEVTLLTSGLAFQPEESKSRGLKLNEFKSRLDQLKQDVGVTADVRVLPPSVLHDRFLVIDDAVWFLGNSLNALGDRASMMVKLPNPEEIITRLNDMSAQAERFDRYQESQPDSGQEAVK